mmetsp:Transcript_8327/g.12286  ORF Transcript_8327/g.12286 Transcript_8327/m.12286 type:complete len:162 (+) Transcript_8327:85-570(+)
MKFLVVAVLTVGVLGLQSPLSAYKEFLEGMHQGFTGSMPPQQCLSQEAQEKISQHFSKFVSVVSDNPTIHDFFSAWLLFTPDAMKLVSDCDLGIYLETFKEAMESYGMHGLISRTYMHYGALQLRLKNIADFWNQAKFKNAGDEVGRLLKIVLSPENLENN